MHPLEVCIKHNTTTCFYSFSFFGGGSRRSSEAQDVFGSSGKAAAWGADSSSDGEESNALLRFKQPSKPKVEAEPESHEPVSRSILKSSPSLLEFDHSQAASEVKQQFVFATQGRGLYALDESTGQYTTVCGTAVGVVLIEKATTLSLLVYDAQRKPLVTGPVPPLQPLLPHAANAYANFKAMGRQYSLAMPAPAATLSLLSASFALQSYQLVHDGAEGLGSTAAEAGKGGVLCESRWMHLIQCQPSAVLVQSDHAPAVPGTAVRGAAALYGVLTSPDAAKDCTAAGNTAWSGPLPGTAAVGDASCSMFTSPLQHLLRGMAPGECRAFLLPMRVAHCALHTPSSHTIQATDMWDLPPAHEVAANKGSSPWAVLHLSVHSAAAPEAAPAAPAASPSQAPVHTHEAASPEEEHRSALADRMAKLSAAGTGRPVMMIARARAASSASHTEHGADHAAPEAMEQPAAHQRAEAQPAAVASPAAHALPSSTAKAANDTARAHASRTASDTGLAAHALPSTHTELVIIDSDDEGVALSKGAPAQQAAVYTAAPVYAAAPAAAPLSNAVLERVLADTGRLLTKVDGIHDSLRDMGGRGRHRRHGSDTGSDSGDSRRRSKRKGRRDRQRRSGGRGRDWAASSASEEDASASDLLSSLGGLLGKTQQYQDRIQALEGKVKELRGSLKASRADLEAAHEAQDTLQEEAAAAKRRAAAVKRAEAQAHHSDELQVELQACKEQLDAVQGQYAELKAAAAALRQRAQQAAAAGGDAALGDCEPAGLIAMLCAERKTSAGHMSSVVSLTSELADAKSAAAGAAEQSSAVADLEQRAAEACTSRDAALAEVAQLKAQLAEAASLADTRLAEAAAAAEGKLFSMKAAFKAEALAAIARAKEEGMALGKAQATAE